MKQMTGALILLFIFGFLMRGADAADVQMSGNVEVVSGSVTATSFTGDGSALTNIDPTKIATGTAGINISGNAATATTVTNGIYTTGTYGDPAWLTSLSGSKLTTGSVAADKIAFYGRVAVVATSGGDYTDPSAAMSTYGTWCPSPSTSNPCLLKIMPGVYTVVSSVVMQSYIDIEGSGEKTTKITGAFSSGPFPSNTGTLLGASNAELRFLTVENTGTGGNTAAISNLSQSPSILHVTATASGGTSGSFGVNNVLSSPTLMNVTATASGAGATTGNVGVFNYSSSPTMTNVMATASGLAFSNFGVENDNSSSPAMTNVTATASGGTSSNDGVVNSSSSPTMTNVTASASAAGGVYNYGVYNSDSSPTMTNVIATASGGASYNYGVYNSASSPTMTNVTASALGGTANYGVYNSTSGTVKINNSVITGSTHTIYNEPGVIGRVGGTKLDGGVATSFGTFTCAAIYDENYTFYASTCP